MQFGKLRHRVTIQTTTQDQNDAGETVPSWSTHATVWADVRTVKGDERYQQQQANAIFTHTVRIRYLSTVTTQMRVVWDSRNLNVVAIEPDRMDANWQILKCREDAD